MANPVRICAGAVALLFAIELIIDASEYRRFLLRVFT
jgi:hypothetical protein